MCRASIVDIVVGLDSAIQYLSLITTTMAELDSHTLQLVNTLAIQVDSTMKMTLKQLQEVITLTGVFISINESKTVEELDVNVEDSNHEPCSMLPEPPQDAYSVCGVGKSWNEL